MKLTNLKNLKEKLRRSRNEYLSYSRSKIQKIKKSFIKFTPYSTKEEIISKINKQNIKDALEMNGDQQSKRHHQKKFSLGGQNSISGPITNYKGKYGV